MSHSLSFLALYLTSLAWTGYRKPAVGVRGWRSVCLCERARRQPSSLSVPSTPHLRTGTAWLLTFTASVGWTNRSHLASMAVMPLGEPGLLLQQPRLPEPLEPRSEHCLVLPPLLGYGVPTKSTASPGCLLPLLHSLRWGVWQKGRMFL